MVNVRFGNYEQFKEAFRNAPRYVQDVLYKAYPDFARQLREEYINATEAITGAKDTAVNATKQATNTIKGSTPKAIGTAVKDTAPNVSKVGGILGKAKFVPGVVGGAWTMLDPKTTWNQKALGAMMMIPQTAPYATAGLITTAIAPSGIDAYYNAKLQADPEYQNAVKGNLVNLNPPTQSIMTPQQRTPYNNQYMEMIYNEAVRQGVDPNIALAVAYNESRFNPNAKNISKGNLAKGTGPEASMGLFQINTLAHPDYSGGLDPQANIRYGIGLLKGHLKATGGDVRKALARYNGSGPSARAYGDRVFGIYTNFANGKMPTGIKSSPSITQNTYTTPTPQTRQDAPQPTFNINQDAEYLNQNQPVLNPIVDPSKLIGEVPDYQTWNINTNNQIQDLQNMINQTNQPQGVQPMQNQAGNDALLEYLRMQNAKQAQVQQANEALLQQYQQASRADAMQNMANQIYNSNQQQIRKAPIYYVGAKGNLNAIEQDQDITPRKPLPTNTTTNVDKLLGEMKIREKANTTNDVTAQVLQAQALGNMYGVDPLVFLNPDIAKEYMKGQNTLENTRVTSSERRMDIPLNTQAKVIEENAKTAGDLALAKAKGYYDMLLEAYKQQGMNTRQAQQLAYQQAQSVFSQEMMNYRLGQELDYKYQALPYNRGTQLMVADAYANRQQPDQELQDQYKRSQIYATGSTFANPQQQQAYWNYVTGGGVNPTNIYGTTPEQDNIFQRIRNNR